MPFEVEYTDKFEEWWNTLDEDAQATVDAYVRMLEEFGVALGFPYSSDIKGSEYSQMRELRAQHKGKPFRVLYAFDPRRTAILLIGGDKTGNRRWTRTIRSDGRQFISRASRNIGKGENEKWLNHSKI